MRTLFALGGFLFCFQALADVTTVNKPDPYARKHYSAGPSKFKAHAKKTKAPSEDEIAAEIAKEDAGTEAAAAKPSAVIKAPVKIAIQKPALAPVKTSALELSTQYPRVVVCKFSILPKKQKQSTMASRYLISDSDGFDACGEHGGDIVAGNDDDRDLMNVKDSVLLKHAKK